MRGGALVFIAAYFGLLVVATAAEVKSLTEQTYAVWFWESIDWSSFHASALAGLIGGFVRTLFTLRSMEPSYRVILTLLADAMVALASGFVAFVLLLAWQSFFSRVPHIVIFVLGFLAGFMRGGFLTWVDDGIKKILAVITDISVGWIASKAGAVVKETTKVAAAKDD